ncbi:MAG: 3-deoxy-D-manno-octulosonic acid transferase [Rhodospirillaceae bacterium]|nr:3-deoxy-D-manno-octulosonic acid transferase [Rhodospirillaceae bacterium]
MIAAAYRVTTAIAAPLIRLYLLRRRSKGKEDAARFDERFGHASLPRPAGPLVWIHAASVGESLSMLAPAERILEARADTHILFTTGTVTSAAILAGRLPPRAFHQYVPVDIVSWVRRFLDHWRPDLALWAESEMWPNLLRDTRRRGIPMALLNGRISARSFAGWQRFPKLARELLSGFSPCLAQSTADLERLTALGAKSPKAAGNLKYAAAKLPFDRAAFESLRPKFAGRPRWLAASTHPGEEKQIAQVHLRLAAQYPNLLTVVAPRHADRASELSAMFHGKGLAVACRSEGEVIHPDTAIYLADTYGELGLLYRLCDTVFLGGSLVAHGGQNLLEPAQFGCALLHGPHMENFEDVVAEISAGGGSLRVADAAELANAVQDLIANEGKRRRMGEAAIMVAERQRTVLDRVMAELAPLLSRLPPEPERRESP